MTEDDQSDAERLEEELEAMAVWERHLEDATEQWKEGVEKSGQEYREGLADALGVEPEDVPDSAVEHWQESVMETDPDKFAGSISGEGADWLIGLYEGTTDEEPPERVAELAHEIEQDAVEKVGDDAEGEEVTEQLRQEISQRVEQTEGDQ